MKALDNAKAIYDLTMNERCEAKVQDLFSKGLHKLMVDLIDELDENESKICEKCKHFQPTTRNEKHYRRCFFFGSINLKYCSEWESK